MSLVGVRDIIGTTRGITLSGKDIVLGIGLPPADFGQQAPGFKRYFMEHSKHFLLYGSTNHVEFYEKKNIRGFIMQQR